ncbi:ABC transporter ATP-binding protein [Gulosibacter molinativorax]|uniref:ABC transporter ATP-binding protein n=1 Tax=Gulosibacter molinativorax TaxID=256821 RepID=A0ABT7C5X0_9MICO|nr:ABC transporter ATP-binding protein [Gulosibacter molinativorax]MDJ1370596.1 ABC transporter ATP-binding protein [Gulosibacter molinativorax]QUY61990.1 Lipoprotein-releasing system ATP-binding protein LolD [Gulosibacter molinativorax]
MDTQTAPRDVIVTNKLSKTFSHGGVQQHVLRNLDLRIREGDFTVLMGPSGAGKSTLLYALSGMDRPTLGSVRFGETELTDRSESQLARFRRSRCGFVFQQVYLLDGMSVMDNVLTAGLLGDRDRKEVVARAHELFDLVGLDQDARGKFSGMLSGGEAQRAAIVRALINEPEVVFADEPTGQLNSAMSEMVLDLLTDINGRGQTIVMVTHDVRTAIRGNRICYLRDGVINGELELPRSLTDDSPRVDALTRFLDEMGW